jgi:hypothetical protein
MFEVWDAASGNRLAAFPSEDEALDLVREMVEQEPSGVGKHLFLQVIDGKDDRVLASGEDLVRKAASRRRIQRVANSTATITYHLEFDANGTPARVQAASYSWAVPTIAPAAASAAPSRG